MQITKQTIGHEACFVCSQGFCFSSIRDCEFGVETEMVFGVEHEGWQGIPHGGVAMTALLDLADHCWFRVKGENLTYPLEIEWRFADAVVIGDKVRLKAEIKTGDTISLSMQRENCEKTYLRAEIKVESEASKFSIKLPDPQELLQHDSSHQALAVYDNCFVCGRKRQQPGLQRRFFKAVVDGNDNEKGAYPVIIVRFGGATARPFQQAQNRLHPGILAALLDELCGWGGVLAGDLYGYTVRFKLNINHLPAISDNFFGLAPTPKVRGRGARQFYYPEGALYRKKEDGSFDIIATASGQWLAKEELRLQFDTSHVEEELKDIVFGA
ncbi:hypothetical protein KAI46_02325 [bacterium]|nr:hypothetical protein [bacterium]